MFLTGFIIAGLNYRYNWIMLPDIVVIISSIIFIIAYILYAEVLRENAYLSRTIEVQESQKVVDTGLYGIVRHPMYAVTILLFLSMPLVLGSIQSFVIFLVYPFIIAKRIKNEDPFCRANVKSLRIISLCFFIVALITFVGCFFYRPFIFIAAAAGFLGLILRVVKNVIQTAVELREESDLTV